MVYVSKRRKFRDFLKNRNNTFYLILILVVIVLTAGIIVIATTKSARDKDNSTETSDMASETTGENETETLSDTIGKYYLRINAANKTVAVYSYDDVSGKYSENPLKVMTCGINRELATKIGDYSYSSDSEGTYRQSWKTINTDTTYRYITGFDDSIVFHSAIYTARMDKTSLNPEDYNTIGSLTDTEGIILALSDAKWIYENCSFDSDISIYSDSSEELTITGADVFKIPEAFYDIYTSDPSEGSIEGIQWCPVKINQFECPEAITIKGSTDDSRILKNLTIEDTNGNSLTEYAILKFTGYYNYAKAGTYHLTVYIADLYGDFYSQSVEMTIKDDGTLQKETESEIETESNNEAESEKGQEIESESENESGTEMETESELESGEDTEETREEISESEDQNSESEDMISESEEEQSEGEEGQPESEEEISENEGRITEDDGHNYEGDGQVPEGDESASDKEE